MFLLFFGQEYLKLCVLEFDGGCIDLVDFKLRLLEGIWFTKDSFDDIIQIDLLFDVDFFWGRAIYLLVEGSYL